MLGRLQSDEKLYKDFCVTHMKLSQSPNDENLKKKAIISVTEMLRRNELGINQYSDKFCGNKEYALFKETPVSERQFGHLVFENPNWTNDVADFYAFTRTCHEFIRLAPSHGISGKYFFEKIDLSTQFF